LNNKLKEKEEICEKHETKIISLRKELDQVKRSWQSSQTLDNILNTQRPQYDKYGIGFKGESSSTKESANKEIQRSYVDILSSHPKEEKSSHQEQKFTFINPRNEGRKTPRKDTTSSQGYSNMYQTIFLGYFFIVKTLVIKPSIARLVRTMLQEIRINKASHLASKNKGKSRLTTIVILWLSMIQIYHYVMIMVTMNKIVHSKGKIYKRMNPLLINVA